jgi:hypothetical protein
MTETKAKALGRVVLITGRVPLVGPPTEHRERFNAAVVEAIKGNRKPITSYLRSCEPIERYERFVLALLFESRSGNPKKKIERLIVDWARRAFDEARAREGLTRLPKGARTSTVLELKRIFAPFKGLRINWDAIQHELTRGPK